MKNWTLKINGRTFTMENDADYEYRSHINGMQTTEPNNWVSCKGTDENGTEITAWYYVEDGTELDSINYDEPSDIADEYGHIIYDSEGMANVQRNH